MSTSKNSKEELGGILNVDTAEIAEISVETVSLQNLLKIIWDQQKTISEQQKIISEQQKIIELQRESISRFLLDSRAPRDPQPGVSGREEVIRVLDADQNLDGGNILK